MSLGLNIDWVYGFSKDCIGSVQSLSTADRNAIFFLSSHSAVIYDYEHRTQLVLQGHCNPISCCAISNDKRWIFTADSGDDPILVVWDSLSGVPVKTIFTPHHQGAIAMDITADALFIVTLGIDENNLREICIWPWTTESDGPLCRRIIQNGDPHLKVSFHPAQNGELSTWGNQSVIFWNWHGTSLEGYLGTVSKSDVGNFTGNYTSTLFLEGSGNAVTCTSDGYVILWESAAANAKSKDAPVVSGMPSTTRTATKVIRLVQCGINLASTTPNGYLVLGCTDGTIKFYDFFLRLEAWYEDLAAGPITSISFALQACPYRAGEGGSPGLKFWCPDMIAGTAQAFILGVESKVFDYARAEERRGTLLLQGIVDNVVGVSCHPTQPLLAILCKNNSLQIWNYEMKLLLNIREFVHPQPIRTKRDAVILPTVPTAIAFQPQSKLIAVGFSNGNVKLIDAENLVDVASFSATSNSIECIKFSFQGEFFSAYDSANHVLLFRTAESAVYDFIGRAKGHLEKIIAIEFGVTESYETLMSLSSDSTLVEYDLYQSSIDNGIKFRDFEHPSIVLDAISNPTSLVWHPHIAGDEEDRFVVAYDSFKFKEYNADSKACRKTTLSPTYGGNIVKMMTHGGLYIYSTANKIIGIGFMPLTGNPNKHIGLVAHSGVISSIAVSSDGKYVFSAGGPDLSVNMWSVETRPEEAKKDDYMDYLQLIDGGVEGALFNDIVDNFYYCQIRAQGEETMETRDTKGLIPLEEVPNFMRAIGYYPTELEIDSMLNEVRYKNFTTTGVLETHIGINELIILYVNYRPVIPINSAQIINAFQSICGGEDIEFGDLKALLTTQGEPITREDLEDYIKIIASGDMGDHLPMNASLFAREILGFEEERRYN